MGAQPRRAARRPDPLLPPLPQPARGVSFAPAADGGAHPTPPTAPAAATAAQPPTPATPAPAARAAARAALDMLLEGNERFASGASLQRARAEPGLLAELADGAHAAPVAVVLACSDARSPPELLFDAGVGDVHVVRVDGGALDPVVVASVLAGVALGARLVLVLGHPRCSAVARAIDAYLDKAEGPAKGSGRRSADVARPALAARPSPSPFAAPAPRPQGLGARLKSALRLSRASAPPAPPAPAARSSTHSDRSDASAPPPSFLARVSVTAAVSHALEGAVAAVARARGGRLRRAEAAAGSPTLPDDASARRLALQSQDSMALTRARLEKNRAASLPAPTPAPCAAVDGAVDDVVDEHVRRCVDALVAALVGGCAPGAARETEVVGARLGGGGRVAVLRRGWLGARGPRYE